jgi:succinylglutamic semialdehyde dehydrogenase
VALARRLTVAAPSLSPNGSISQPAMPSSGQSSEQPSATEEAFMGPVINRSAMAQLLQAQQQLLDAGGVALMTMKQLDPDSCLLSPGIVDMTATLTNGQTVADEEWFGPLLQLYRVTSFDQAMTLANTTRFGLAAGLISDNPTWQQTFAEQIRAGVIAINQPTAGAASTLPFGGIGASGNHRPSAWYAADYCAWPQAASHGPASYQAPPFSTTGIRS